MKLKLIQVSLILTHLWRQGNQHVLNGLCVREYSQGMTSVMGIHSIEGQASRLTLTI